MTLRVACSCGWENPTPADWEGRWIRCASCGKLIQIRHSRGRRTLIAPRGDSPAPPPIPTQESSTTPAHQARPDLPDRRWWESAAARRVGILLVVLNSAIVAGVWTYANRQGARVGDPQPLQPREGAVNGAPSAARPTAPKAPGATVAVAALSTQEIVARSEGAVARIKGRFGSGSGFLVGPGLLATNAHVVRGEIPTDIQVYFPSRDEMKKGPYRSTLVYEDRPRDITLLKLDVPFPPLPLAIPHRFRRGEDVTIIGSPGFGDGALENAVSRGVLSTEHNIEGRNFYQLGASVNPGNSGGPALNSQGEVVGVVTLKAAHEESIGFCIPIDDLAQAVDRSRNTAPEAVRDLTAAHAASAVFQRLVIRASLCIIALNIQSKRIENILEHRRDSPDQAETVKVIHQKLTELNGSFDDGYRIAVAELLNNPALAEDLRRDLRDFWSTCDDMSRSALDSRLNLGRFRDEAGVLIAHAFELINRLKPRLSDESD